MVVLAPNPDCDCRLCNHKTYTEDGSAIFCPMRKITVDFKQCIECGTECEDRDINPDWLAIDRALRQGREYQRTGDIRAFMRAPR